MAVGDSAGDVFSFEEIAAIEDEAARCTPEEWATICAGLADPPPETGSTKH